MTITTIDGLIAAFQPPRFFSKAISGTLVAGRNHSYWGAAGVPGAGAYDTTLNGVTLSSSVTPVDGQMPYPNPSGTASYLSRFSSAMTQIGTVIIADRVWHNGGFNITSTSPQAITSPAWPARDNSGATTGEGILLGLEVSSATGAGTPTITVSYTNTTPTGSRAGTNIKATVASSIAGTFHPLSLQSGDTGVKSVESLTLSATWTSGTINLVAYRILAQVEVNVANGAAAIDAITGGLPQMYAGSVPFLFILPNTTTASQISGQVVYANG